MTTPEDIDALLAAPKTLAGQIAWKVEEGKASAELKAPVLHDGVVSSLQFYARATLTARPQHGVGVLLYEARPIQRIHILPDHPHTNPPDKRLPAELRSRKLPTGVTRIYPWRLNRRWPREPQDRLNAAHILDADVTSVADGLAIFLAFCAIEVALPPPPWEPELL